VRNTTRRRVPATLVLASAARPGLAVACALLLAGCFAAPIGARRVDPRTVHRTLTRNVLNSGKPSGPTRNVLEQRALVDRFDDDPEQALAALHAAALSDGGQDELFALAELSFLHAEDTGSRPHYLASAVYAWTFLFPEGAAEPPSPFDPRFRTACDLYNRGITAGLEEPGSDEVALRSETYALPFGALDVTLDPAGLTWGDRTLTHFIPVAEYEIRGLPTRHRWPGLGAPLAARTEPTPGQPTDDFVAPGVLVPVSALLRLDGARAALPEGRLAGTLEVRPATGPEAVTLEGKPVPLENESTATLAYMLAESPVWRREIAGFLESIGGIDVKTQLRALEPYRPGRIPVVFVHGTASSAGRWAQMVNELDNDPRLLDRYQFWFFTYDTGNPIGYSAMLLREALSERVAILDPTGADPALRQMVVIGHSQGGLLTKTTVVDSGSRFWDNVSRKPIDQLDLSDESRRVLRGSLFYTPLPFVRVVIFIATPQRGSYMAGNWLAHYVARFVTLPNRLLRVTSDLLTLNKDALALAGVSRMPTAVHNMTPGNPWVKTLASLPMAPGVEAHSIIAVTGDGPPEGQDDGVVEYESAHIDGVVSEFVVRSPHSCQDNPDTINEVRRILLEHAAGEEQRAAGAEPALAAAPR